MTRSLGTSGDDELYGFGGNDTLDGGGGKDRLWGGDGDDKIIFGTDESGLATRGTYYSEQGADDIYMGDEWGWLRYDEVASNRGILVNFTGSEKSYDSYSINGVLQSGVTLSSFTVLDQFGDIDEYFEAADGGHFWGSALDDVFISDEHFWWSTSGGHDLIIAGEGSSGVLEVNTDTAVSWSLQSNTYDYVGRDGQNYTVTVQGQLTGLQGDDGDDVLIGNDSDNRLGGGRGDDVLTGGEGYDTFRIWDTAGSITITDYESGEEIQFNDDIGFLSADSFTATYTASTDQTAIEMTLAGTTYTPVYLTGEFVINGLRAPSGDDYELTLLDPVLNEPNTILGTSGDDELYGFGGNDTLDGGGGKDRLWGGDGDDKIIFGTGESGLATRGTYYSEQGADDIYMGDEWGWLRYDEVASNRGILVNFTGSEKSYDSYSINGVLQSGVTLSSFTVLDQFGDIDEYFEAADGGHFWGSALDDVFISDEHFWWSTSGGHDLIIAGEGSSGVLEVNTDTAVSWSLQSNTYDYVGRDGQNYTVTVQGQLTGLQGDDGDDVLIGNDSDNRLGGGRGDDVLTGGEGYDTFRIWDTAGSITITDYKSGEKIEFNDDIGFLRADSFTATYTASTDQTAIEMTLAGTTYTPVYLTGEFVINGLRAPSGDDYELTLLDPVLNEPNTILGTSGDDELYGFGGNDTLDGGGGKDTLIGGDGDDTLIGGDGRDRLIGGTGDDVLDASTGSKETQDWGDIVKAGLGNDTIIGHEAAWIADNAGEKRPDGESYSGLDIIYDDTDVNNGAGIIAIFTEDGRSGTVTSRLQSSEIMWFEDTFTFADRIEGTQYDDLITGSNQRTETFVGEGGNDTIDGFSFWDEQTQTGWDTIDYRYEEAGDAAVGVHVNLSTGTATDTFGDTDTLLHIDGAYGSDANDVLIGNDRSNWLSGEDGNDALDGGEGNDWLYGGAGDDTLGGGGGGDTLEGGLGFDVLNGGDGDDLLNGGADVDWIRPGYGSDRVDGGTGSNTVLYENLNEGIIVNNTAAEQSGTAAHSAQTGNLLSNDSITNVTNFHTTYYDDVYYTDTDGYVFLRSGDDQATVFGSNVQILPGSGDDTIIGLNNATISLDYSDGLYDGNGSATTGIEITFSGVGSGVVQNDGWGNEDTYTNVTKVTGNSFNDVMTGDAGDEAFFGGDGNDSLIGGAGDDTLNGGDGDDTLFGYSGRDHLYGGKGNDLIYASGSMPGGSTIKPGDDGIDQTQIYDGAGDDQIIGVSNGGVGIDVIVGSGNDIYRATGDARGGGGERLRFDETEEGIRSEPIVVRFDIETAGIIENDGFGGRDEFYEFIRVTGSSGNDEFYGSDGYQKLEGKEGDDYISGLGGNDRLNGDEGNDTLIGGDGDDTLIGGDGRDRLIGGTGDDVLDASTGSKETQDWGDIVRAGLGNDTIIGHEAAWIADNAGEKRPDGESYSGLDIIYDDTDVNNGAGIIAIFTEDGRSGTVTSRLQSSEIMWFEDTFTFADRIEGTHYDDIITGSNQRTESFVGEGGNDTIDGFSFWDEQTQTGWDTIDYRYEEAGDAAVGVHVNLSTGTATDTFGDTDTLLHIDGAYGSDANDVLIGNDRSNWLSGEDGNDALDGGEGNDWLYGGAGDDTLDGGGGEDTLFGGLGDDALNGGDGLDRLDFQNMTTSVAVDFASGTATGVANGTDRLTSIEGVTGSDFDDTLTGSDRTDIWEEFRGGLGNDIIDGAGGNDFISYSNSSSAINLNLSTGVVTGGAGTDQLTSIEGVTGSDFDDTLIGSDRTDVWEEFQGGLGNDTINGAGGNDLVSYRESVSAVNVDLSTGIATGGAGTDQLISIEQANGSDFDDTLTGSDRTDIWEEFRGGLGNDIIDGAGGNDFISYSNSSSAINLNLSTGVVTGGAGTDQLTSIEGVTGSDFDDTLIGSDRTDVWEEFQGGLGNDTINGAGGNDLVSYRESVSAVNVDLSTGIATGGAGTDQLISIEQANGGDFNDTLIGSDGSDRLYGGDGNDDLSGGSGNDTLTGGDGDDNLYGGDGDDTLDGGAGNDFVYGGDGDDIIIQSGSGRQHYDGGNGVDTYKIDIAAWADYDFEIAVNLSTGFSGLPNYPDHLKNDSLVNFENVDWSNIGWDVYLTGDEDSNSLTSGIGNDTLDGGAGTNSLTGGLGDDTYKYNYSGSDTIFDIGGRDTLILTTRDTDGNRYFGDTYVENGTLVFGSHQDANNTLRITDALGADSRIENVTFHADDESYADYTLRLAGSNDQLTGDNILYIGTKENDTIVMNNGFNEAHAGDGDDIIIIGDGGSWVEGDLGDDKITAGAGIDKFHYRQGEGNDTIIGFEDGVDQLIYQGFTTEERAQFVSSTTAQGHTLITHTDGSTILKKSIVQDGIGGLNIEQLSKTGDVVTYGLIADASYDLGGDGIGALDFAINFDVTNFDWVDGSLTSDYNWSMVLPNETEASSGVVKGGFIGTTKFKDFSDPIAEFQMTVLETSEPVALSITGTSIDGGAAPDTIETFSYMSSTLTATVITRDGKAMDGVTVTDL